jgi:hypothetical protein
VLFADARGRLETFINDAQRRIARLGTPLSTKELTRVHEAAVRIRKLRANVEAIPNELNGLIDDLNVTAK